MSQWYRVRVPKWVGNKANRKDWMLYVFPRWLKSFVVFRWPLFDQIVVSASNFIIGVVIVRGFGVDEYGVYIVLWAVVQFTQSFQLALLIAPMQTVGPTMGVRQERYYSGIIRYYLLFALCCGLVVFIATRISYQWLPSFWREEYSFGLFVWIISMQLQDGMRRLLFACGNEGRAFFVDLIAYPGQIFVIIGAAMLQIELWKTIFYFSSVLCASAILAVYGNIKIWGNNGMRVRDVWGYNWPVSRWLAASAALQWFSANYVLMMAAVILGPAVSGAIRAAQNLLALTHVLFQALENIVPVRSAERYQKGGWPELVRYVTKIGTALVVTTAIITVLTLYLIKPLLGTIYGSVLSESLIAATWYVPIYLCIAATFPARIMLRVIGKTRSIFVGYLASATFCVFLADVMIHSYRVYGVMAMILIAYFLILIPQYFQLIKEKS